MPVYTVHAPSDDGAAVALAAADRFVFVRDGFHVWAFLFGPLWLLVHRLWWALLGYVVLSVALGRVLSVSGIGIGGRLAVTVLVMLLMGMEAASLRRWTLSRRGWRQLDVVVADDKEAAERRFFDRWTARRHGPGPSPASDRGGPPPLRSAPGLPFSQPPSPAQNDVIGLFPQPGAAR